LLAAAVSLVAAVSLAQPIGELRQPIIYGEDDRREVYEAESEVMRALARASVVALVSPRSLSYEPSGAVSIHAPTLDEAFFLCDGEAFAEQPNLAFCSGVLVDDDLVATAGHCLGDSYQEAFENCRALAIVFDYLYEAPGQLAPLSAEEIYRCRQVVTWSPGGVDPDFAVIQLDRAVRPGLSPASFAENEVTLGQHVNVIGFGAGLPAKVDSGAAFVQDTSLPEYFTAPTDTFGGNSGSPLFDDAGQLLGLNVRGQPDWRMEGFCTAAVRATFGDEIHQRTSSVLAAICDGGWPSLRLCGTAAACGDGVCSASESCPADCPLPSCGDGLCEGSEPSDCYTDCPSFVEIPPDWTCPIGYYGDRLGCDCNCGGRDVDCDNPYQEVLNCPLNAFCNAEGACERVGAAGDEPEGVDINDQPVNDGRPASADAARDGDEFILDELDIPAAPVEKASSDGGCAISSSRAPATDLAPWLLLLVYRRRRRC
jgi:Trypsin-like peptidase domain